jgi:hypothetical protein
MKRVDSVQFLMHRTGMKKPDTSVGMLAQALGDLPLAMEQAAACIERTRIDFTGYLKRFETHWAELLKSVRPGGDYPDSVAMTWELSFRQVQEEAPAAADLDAQLGVLAGLEDEYRGEIAAHLEAAEGGVPPDQFFRWSADLKGAAAHLQGIEHWDALESQRILPRLLQALQVLDQGLSGPLAESWQGWRARYLPELRTALGAIRHRAAARSRARVEEVEQKLDPLLPEERRGETLSRKALWVVASTPGVSAVLNGARRPEYVDDALGILRWPPLPGAVAVLERFRAGAG